MRRLLPVTKEGWGCLAVILVIGVAWGWYAFQNHFDGNRPLYEAIEAADSLRVQAMLDSGADPNSQSRGFSFISEGLEELGDFPESPLARAVAIGDESIVRMLLHNGARPISRSHDGHSLLMSAAWAGNAAIVSDLLLKGAVPIPEDYDDPTAWARDMAMTPEIRTMLDAAGFPSPFAPPPVP